MAVRLGAEYRIVPPVPVRAGFICDQGPVPRATVGPELPDADRYEVTMGGGYTWQDLRVDLAYQFLTAGTITSPASSPLPGSWSANAHLVGLTVGYSLNL